MITSKELQYVKSWASSTPMPGIDYSMNVLRKMEECYNIFNSKYRDKEYNIIFSNGEEIKLEILEKNLCHMLGVNYKNLTNEYFANYRKIVLKTETSNITSYELLGLLIEHAKDVAEYDNSTHKEKAINYYKSGIKSTIFKKLSDFEQFNFGAINYDPKDNKYDYINQKLLFIPSNQAICPYFMMGIKKADNVSQDYITYTLLAPKEYQEAVIDNDTSEESEYDNNSAKNYFDNQEVIIPTQILISDNNVLNKIQATPEEKMRLLTMYKSIITKYGIPNRLNIYGDYEAMLNDLDRTYQKVKN